MHHGRADCLLRPADDIVEKYDELVTEAIPVEDTGVDLMANLFDKPLCFAVLDSLDLPVKEIKRKKKIERRQLIKLHEDIVSGMHHMTLPQQQVFDITINKICEAQCTDNLCKLIRVHIEAGDTDDDTED